MFGKTVTLTALATTLAIGATAMPSLADQRRGQPSPERGFIFMLQNADTNQDGKISQEEALAFQNGRFEQIDANGDGVITPGEFADFRKAQFDTYMKDNPRNMTPGKQAAASDNARPQAGQTARNDAQPGPGGMRGQGNQMARNDMMAQNGQQAGPKGMYNPDRPMAENGRGGPDGSQRHMAMNDDGQRGGQNWGMGPGGDRQMRGPAGHGQRDTARMFFVRADTDRSGQVSEAEFARVAKAMFERMDTNGDMIITIQDLPARPMR